MCNVSCVICPVSCVMWLLYYPLHPLALPILACCVQSVLESRGLQRFRPAVTYLTPLVLLPYVSSSHHGDSISWICIDWLCVGLDFLCFQIFSDTCFFLTRFFSVTMKLQGRICFQLSQRSCNWLWRIQWINVPQKCPKMLGNVREIRGPSWRQENFIQTCLHHVRCSPDFPN